MGKQASDPRLTPARADLAAAHLKGRITAARYAEGQDAQVTVPVASLYRRPSSAAPMDSQLLMGETFRVYENRNGWAWGQGAADGYVGYVAADTLGHDITPPTHRVCVLATFIYEAPDIKSPVVMQPGLNARLALDGTAEVFGRCRPEGYVFAAHCVEAHHKADDFVAVATLLTGAPYLWGGCSAWGVDCSGLVRMGLAAAGIACPRDTDMQEEALGAPVSEGEPLRRGDLVFWLGHVSIMLDEARMLHASAHHMQVVAEPFAQAVERIGPARTIKRL